MKKLLAMLLVAGSLAMTACKPTNYTASATKTKMQGSGYTVQTYTYSEAKDGLQIRNLNYQTVVFENALYAEKGTGDDKDLLLAFFFSTVEQAEKFMSDNNYENMGLMRDYGVSNLGSKLGTPKVGSHNNVAYVGSEAAFNVAFN